MKKFVKKCLAIAFILILLIELIIPTKKVNAATSAVKNYGSATITYGTRR